MNSMRQKCRPTSPSVLSGSRRLFLIEADEARMPGRHAKAGNQVFRETPGELEEETAPEAEPRGRVLVPAEPPALPSRLNGERRTEPAEEMFRPERSW